MISPLPKFTLHNDDSTNDALKPSSQWIEQLQSIGFHYSHRIVVENAARWHPDDEIRIDAFINVNSGSYALATRLFHKDTQILFTNYYTQGHRLITSRYAGSLLPSQMLDASHPSGRMAEVHLIETGDISLAEQWQQHQQNAEIHFANQHSLLFKPEQNLLIERGFYLRYLKYLVENRMLSQPTNAPQPAAARPAPREEQEQEQAPAQQIPQPAQGGFGQRLGRHLRGLTPTRLPLPSALTIAVFLLAGSILFTMANIRQIDDLDRQSLLSSMIGTIKTSDSALGGNNNEAMSEELYGDLDSIATSTDNNGLVERDNLAAKRAQLPVTETEKGVVASANDEMWHISVENAEFYLMSQDGDPSPWIRSARRIAASFSDDDPRLARTYFLGALVERDYLVAEQHFKRALDIQTSSLGLYHAETAQTLEALAWLAENDKNSLEEAISYQQLAINIYQQLFGPDAEDTRAAIWKMEYFENRLAGITTQPDENRRLLPALAKFDR